MKYTKLISTLIFESSDGEKFKYDIFQDFPAADFYAVIHAQQEVSTEKYGNCPTWIVINGYLRLGPLNPVACDEECKAHFMNHY